ncbi:MAG: AMP-binding protein [Spirochaetes bacterium]|nr:AMP-binding protein [Spirochaetota bacterium]
MLKNLFQMLENSAVKYKDKAVFSSKVNEKYADISYGDFYKKVKILISGLIEAGIKKGDKIFLFSDNRLEWILLDFAFQGLGAVTVPRGTDTGLSEAEFIINHSGSNYLVIENTKAEEKINKLKFKGKKIAIENGVKECSFYFDMIMKSGKENFEKNRKRIENLSYSINESDLVTIIYTSGTTGNPKGVMLSHQNFLHDITNALLTLPVSDKDVTISVLPIWHIFERTVEYVMIYSGANVYYSSIKTFVNDVKIIKPTMVIVVPRILEAFYDKVQLNISKMKGFKKGLFNFVYNMSMIYFSLGNYIKKTKIFYKRANFLVILACSIVKPLFLSVYALSRILFKSIKNVLGGKVRLVISGGGSLPIHIDKFFNLIGLCLVDGYGLTETSPIIALRDPCHPVIGTSGAPIKNIEVKIISPDGNHAPAGQKGELIVKGGIVMQGYYSNKAATDKVLTNGWFHTGDLAVKTYYGEVKILGRIKDTIVLSGGENIEPEKIETYINRSELVENSVVIGQNQKRLKALVVPNREKIIDMAADKKISYSDYESLINSDKIYDQIRKEINENVNSNPEFKSFEKIFEFTLIPDAFKIGEELTQSLKLKRYVIYEKYKKIIDEMFKKK